MVSVNDQPGQLERGGRFITAPSLRAHLYQLIVLCGEMLAAGHITAAHYIAVVGGLLGTLRTLRVGGEGAAHGG